MKYGNAFRKLTITEKEFAESIWFFVLLLLLLLLDCSFVYLFFIFWFIYSFLVVGLFAFIGWSGAFWLNIQYIYQNIYIYQNDIYIKSTLYKNKKQKKKKQEFSQNY